MGKKRVKWFGKTECNLCGQKISQTLYDGKTKEGGAMWSTMCSLCFQQHGAGVGWGCGQKFEEGKKGNFYLTEGGAPEE